MKAEIICLTYFISMIDMLQTNVDGNSNCFKKQESQDLFEDFYMHILYRGMYSDQVFQLCCDGVQVEYSLMKPEIQAKCKFFFGHLPCSFVGVLPLDHLDQVLLDESPPLTCLRRLQPR